MATPNKRNLQIAEGVVQGERATACTKCSTATAFTPDWTLYPWPDGAWLCATCNDARHETEDYNEVEAKARLVAALPTLATKPTRPTLLVNTFDSRSALTFSEAEAATGIAAMLVGLKGYADWYTTVSERLNGWSGMLWLCIECARITERYATSKDRHWERYDFYIACENIAEALIQSDLSTHEQLQALVEEAVETSAN